MKISSPAFGQGGKIPSKYTCDADDINPPLQIADVPAQAKSLVLIVDDPDIPAQYKKEMDAWIHWILFNLSPTVRTIEENTTAGGIVGSGTRDIVKYQGPCPPDREHRYFFKLYALDQLLPLKQGATLEEVTEAMQGHILAQAELMGKYERLAK